MCPGKLPYARLIGVELPCFLDFKVTGVIFSLTVVFESWLLILVFDLRNSMLQSAGSWYFVIYHLNLGLLNVESLILIFEIFNTYLWNDGTNF